jgi:hypothetical protein
MGRVRVRVRDRVRVRVRVRVTQREGTVRLQLCWFGGRTKDAIVSTSIRGYVQAGE